MTLTLNLTFELLPETRTTDAGIVCDVTRMGTTTRWHRICGAWHKDDTGDVLPEHEPGDDELPALLDRALLLHIPGGEG